MLSSFSVSPGATAAKTSTPLPMEDTTSWSTVTEADNTRCNMAYEVGQIRLAINSQWLATHTLHLFDF